ncbi:MAG TPA: hypothetical protein VFR81_20045 [Longimicrobium sp.]|nr:hypothetical protein [Longimicrobium sp.]
MTRLRLAAGLSLSLALASAPALAQGEDARVLPRGWVEVRGGGTYTQFHSRFAEGGTEELGALFETQLQTVADRLLTPVLGPVRSRLEEFFTGTAGEVPSPVTPEAVTAGTAAARIASDRRDVPFTLAYGLTRRITVGVTVPIQRRGTAVQGIRLADGTLGLNPNAARNASVLAEVDSAYVPLGQSRYLPTAGSPAGVELQRRVEELTGDTLSLPRGTLTFANLLDDPALAALLEDADSIALNTDSRRTEYQLGDVEVGARFQLVNSVPGYPFPDSAGARGVRTSVGVRVRLPTGAKTAGTLLEVPPTTGHFGFGVDLLNDWFLSSRWWVTASGAADVAFGADVRRLAFLEEQPFPRDTLDFRTLRREPGARIAFALTPRYRLTQELGFAAQYAFAREGETELTASDELGPVLLGYVETTEARTAHQLGLGMSYSTVNAYRAGRTPVPIEVSLLYRNVVAGSGRAPKAGSIEVVGRVPYQLFGRPRRERADTARADTVVQLPPPDSAARVPRQPGDRPRVTPQGERPAPAPAPAPPPAPAPAPAPAPPPPPAPAPPPRR